MITHIAAAGISVLAWAVALQVEIIDARIDKQRVLRLAAGAYGYLCQVVVAAARVAPCIGVGNADRDGTVRIDAPLRVTGDDAVNHRSITVAGEQSVFSVVAVNRAVIDSQTVCVADCLYTIVMVVVNQAVLN